MQSKSLLIAIAAFAVTTTGVHAFADREMLNRAGLSEEQVLAFEEAKELRRAGDKGAARDVLLEAGVTEDVLRSLHGVAKQVKEGRHEALEANDYEAFLSEIAGTPLADIITSEADFDTFREAYLLKQGGEWLEAKALFDELGVTAQHHHGAHGGGYFQSLTEAQRDALQVARQANDTETVQAILEEAGLEYPPHRHRHHAESEE